MNNQATYRRSASGRLFCFCWFVHFVVGRSRYFCFSIFSLPPFYKSSSFIFVSSFSLRLPFPTCLSFDRSFDIRQRMCIHPPSLTTFFHIIISFFFHIILLYYAVLCCGDLSLVFT